MCASALTYFDRLNWVPTDQTNDVMTSLTRQNAFHFQYKVASASTYFYITKTIRVKDTLRVLVVADYPGYVADINPY